MASFLANNEQLYKSECIRAQDEPADTRKLVNKLLYFRHTPYRSKELYKSQFNSDDYETIERYSKQVPIVIIHLPFTTDHPYVLLINIPIEELKILMNIGEMVDFTIRISFFNIQQSQPIAYETDRWFHSRYLYHREEPNLAQYRTIYETYSGLMKEMNKVSTIDSMIPLGSRHILYVPWARRTMVFISPWLLTMTTGIIMDIDKLDWYTGEFTFLCEAESYDEAIKHYRDLKPLLCKSQQYNDDLAVSRYIMEHFLISDDQYISADFLYKCVSYDCGDNQGLATVLRLLQVPRHHIKGRIYYGLRSRYDVSITERPKSIYDALMSRIQYAFHALYQHTKNINDTCDMVVVVETIRKHIGFPQSRITQSLITEWLNMIQLRVIGDDYAGLKLI